MPPLHFGTVLDQKLIKLVRENPLLYNPDHPVYSSSDAKELTWQKISDALGRPTAEFAGIQCQIQFGDYNEEKHKPGFIENLSEYLPAQYCSSWGIEKKILKEYSTHGALQELEAKHLYTKTARALPTYGVTFFLVKEKQKGKKKLVPRLLGINAEAILRLDETSKEIIQTWPLTHVKTYHAGKGETFTLNFGDYTDKEYSVKTRDAFRIRDILEGYIDLIRKRMLAHYNVNTTEHGYIGQDNISSGQASVVQHIWENPSKVIEHSFVGPSKIVESEPGQVASQGTQITTTHQLLMNEMKNKQEQGVLKAEVGMRQDMGIKFTRRLNRLNSNSVQIVTLLTEPSKAHVEDAKKIVDDMNADMSSIREGVNGTIAKQSNDEEKKKLQDQLNELDALMKILSQSTDPASVDASEANDAAKRIATLSTEMYFAVAPETRRRSSILSKFRSSFIADEKTEKNLRRASFIAASATTNHALDSAVELAQEPYKGPELSPQQVEELENAALDKLGKINAAVAQYMLAHADPQNIDYATAVNSLNTMHELMPDLARDAQALASVKDGKDRTALIKDIQDLCAASKHVCSLSGVDDAQKLQDASSKYADVSGRLVYVFGRRGAKRRADKEDQILNLADEVVDKTSVLLNSAQGLTKLAASEAAAADVNEAGARTAVVAKTLQTQALLNAPTIQEPHCQSALTAASEALSLSAQHLAASWKPLVEHPSRHVMGEKLHNQTMDLAKALDKLTEAYSTPSDTQDVQATAIPEVETQRLQFINSLSKVGGNWKAAEDDLNKPLSSVVSDTEATEAQKQLAGRVAQLNAALAALLAATSDRENPDYATAEAATSTINELIPELIKDSKVASANHDEASKAALLDDIKALCAATKNVCASAYSAEPEALNEALNQFTKSSGKLTYVCNRRANPDRESKIIDATSSACAQAGVLLSGVQALSEMEGGDVGGKLDAQGAALADAAQTLLSTAQVTAASMSDPRCQSTLFSAIDKVSSAGKDLEKTWAPLKENPKHDAKLKALETSRNHLEKELVRLKHVCQLPDNEIQESQSLELQSADSQFGWKLEGQSALDGPREQEKLQFIANLRGAKDKLANAEKELNKPAMPAKGSDMGAVQQRLTQGLDELNAAVAALLAATADRDNPDCSTAEKAATTISELMPQIIKDTKTVSTTLEAPARAAMLAEIKTLCDASQTVCASSYGEDKQGLNDAVAKFSDASGKLVFVVNPRKNTQKQKEISKLADVACGETSALLSGVKRLAKDVGGPQGRELDVQGALVADKAQNLLNTVKITSKSEYSPECRAALLASVDSLSQTADQLSRSLAAVSADPKHGAQAQKLAAALKQLREQLDTLRNACDAPVSGSQELSQEQQKLQFIKTVEATKGKWADAQAELKKAVPAARGTDAGAAQLRLAQRLAALDGAVAALLAATADRDKPSYAEAEKSVNTVSELLPHIVQDTKTVCASKEEPARAAMLAEIKALCDASQAICAGSYGEDTQGLNDAVAKFSDASGKLVFQANPRLNSQKQKEVLDRAGAVCGSTAALLSGVQQLAADVSGARGQELDVQGGRLADQAQNLLHTAQITGKSLSSPECRAALLASVDSLSQSADQLSRSLAAVSADPKHGTQAQKLVAALKQLREQLDTLKNSCSAPGSQELSQEQQKLQFIKTVEATKGKWADAQAELKKAVPATRGADAGAAQSRLAQRLAALDGAVAALLAATADRDKPSYAEAEKSVNTVSELLPHIVQDTKTVCASKEEPARAAMLAEIKALCDASQAICASSYGEDTQGLNNAIAKFSDASGKLVFQANPRLNSQKQKEVLDGVGAVCGSTAALLSGVQQLAADVSGARGQELDVQGGRLADQAQNLLHTAQITGKSLSSPECRAALLASVDSLSQSADQLSRSLAAVSADPKHGAQAQKLAAALKQLREQLYALKNSCSAPVSGSQELSQEQQKLQFIKTVEATKGKWADAQAELKKAVPATRGADAGAAQSRLAHRLAALDGAVAALLAATADREKPSYAKAEKSVKTVSELLPHIVQDTKTVCASKEEPARAAMLAEIKALCDASQAICASSYGEDTQGLNDAVAKFSDASGKLVYQANPRLNSQKQKEVLDEAGAVCGSTAALLSGVQQLASDVGGARGRDLDVQGGRLADQAQNLLHTAQITGKSVSSPECRAALLASVDSLTQSADQLSRSLAAVSADPKHGAQAQKLAAALKQLREQLDTLKNTCSTSEPPLAVCKQPPPLPATEPPSHVAHAPPRRSHAAELAHDFLERMRCEEGLAHQPISPSLRTGPAVVGGVNKVKPPPPARRVDDDKQRAAFSKTLEYTEKTIKKHEAALMKQCRSPTGAGPALSHRDMMQKQAQLQRHLAQAGVEVANLVAANYADKIDYTAASKSTKALPQLMTDIVEEGTQLSDNLNDMARKAFLYDMLQMCDAARKICDAAGTDRQKLNDAAVHFGDTSTKLLYVVSSDVDPALEKEIITRTKAIGDSASRLALDAANVATAAGTAASGTASSVQEICDAGTACVDAAGKLVYTAKLTAPSIHERACQDALVASTDTLSSKLKSFAASWKPLESEPQQAKTISHLSAEATNLESILEGLRSDVREGNIGRRRELEQLVIEDTPIRQLTVKILDEAKVHAESPSLPTPQKIAYAAYADKLTEALRVLDLANARCKKTSHDTNKRRDLEEAVQNLQMILLQSRPSRGDKGKSNIVDLMDFMEEVSADAKKVSTVASSTKVPTAQDKRTLEEIKEKCDNLETKANQLIRGEVSSDLDFNDLFDQFGQECDDVIKQLKTEVKGMEDVKAKSLLQSKVMGLSESCNMLRFATKSGISTEACATLDASLDELDDIENRVIKSVVKDAAPHVTLRSVHSPRSGRSPVVANLCREVASSPSSVATSTVTAYIADAAARADATNPEQNNKLLKHLYKLVHLLKTLTVTSSKRAATWQPVDCPETARITEQILQEIYNPESKSGVEPDDKKQKIFSQDVSKLLIPAAPKILGDHKQQEAQQSQVASQLSAQCGVLARDPSRATLSRDAALAVDLAKELDGIARGANVTDPVQRRRIDEAAKEMSFCTYNVLTTAESVCLEPKNSSSKRRLADALQNLNHAIDKLMWHASSSPVLQRQCGALSRGTAAQLAALQPRPTSAAPFAQTCDLIAQQNENISKLKSDQPMLRKEFMRNLDDIGSAVRTSVEGAAQCAYYIAISDQHKDLAKDGVVDVPKIQLALESVQDACMAIISASQYDQAKEQKDELQKRVLDFSNALDNAQIQVKDGDVRKTLMRARSYVSEAADKLKVGLERQNSMEEVAPQAVSLLDAVNQAHSMIEQCSLVPPVGTMSQETQKKCDEVMNHSKSMLTNTLALLKDVNSAPEEPEMMTWVTFDSNRKKLLDAYDALVKSVRRNGHRAGIYDKEPEAEKEEIRKSYVETHVNLANRWLKSPSCRTEVKVIGQLAARNVVDMARQISEDLKGSEREEVRNMITETEELLSECSRMYDHEKNSLLMDRLKELRKCIQRGVVTRVVEVFIEAEAPLADLDLLADIERDETKRKFILERKIASLLAQLGRVTKTARFVANASQHQSVGVDLTRSSEQTELLAPLLVKAAQQRIDHPNDEAVVENYKALLAQYADSISKVRDLCDRAVDPMDFVQTAGVTMERMREDMAHTSSDPQKCAYSSNAINKLANRVIHVSMSSNAVASDPELQKALLAAKQRLHAVTPAPNARASGLPDWRDTTAEILRTTGEIESALGGENIFKKEPTTANQPIYSVARDLHESVREWSSRDNEIVGVARRMAVLMARLSEYMETDKTDALIATSKSIVAESREVAELAKKLAHECSDVRIKTNLLQTCERIPTISGQLKMLTTVKASSLGQQGLEADKEAMDMLVVNAESLMLSIQEVVKAAAGASVKIMSQRGPRLRWVRKNYY